MLQMIINYIKKYNVTIILNKKLVTDLVDFLLLDFIDDKGLYWSLLLAYNSVEIFCNDRILIGNGVKDFGYYIDRNIKCFNNKERWISGRYDQNIPATFIKILKIQLDSVIQEIIMNKPANCTFLNVEITMKPCKSLIINYRIDGKFNSIILYTDTIQIVSKKEFEFLESLRLPEIFKYKGDDHDSTRFI